VIQKSCREETQANGFMNVWEGGTESFSR
jgi:hypothetical protein